MKVRLQRNKEGNGSQYSLNVRLENVQKRKTSRAFAPRFPKVKEEAWWLVLGDSMSSELFALKRVSFSNHLVTHMNLPSTAAVSQWQLFKSGNAKASSLSFGELSLCDICKDAGCEGLKLILVSDCYVGYELEHSLDHLLEPGH
ncbi:hypothetical protein KSS87_003087 [Heliosperma pusillum]|nr:hypothetical protein KSS87_003087 [Heliosperma pusillum]